MAVDVSLIVNGRRYSGWESVRVTRSIETLAGSFALQVSDRWGDDDGDPLPIEPEDACRVEIGEPGKAGTVVIDGYIDAPDINVNATSRALSFTGKDRAAALVECSLLVGGASVTGSKWSYKNIDVAEFVRQIAAPHGIKVSVQPGLELKRDPLLVAHPGETGFEAIKRAAASTGVLVVSDGAGGILITRAGNAAANQLTEGFNILTASVRRDATDRYHKYLITTQIPGTDEASGEATQVQAEAIDEDVRRTSRVLIIRPDKGYSTADARRRADWEARTRAARAVTVSIGVQGWQQPNGTLWPLNALVRVKAPRMLRIDGQMLISEVEYSMGPGGQITQLKLVRPDAFEPEPTTATVSGAGKWDELAGGV